MVSAQGTSASPRRCQFCESEISETAKKCRQCGEWLETPLAAPGATAAGGSEADSFIPSLGEGTLLSGRYRLDRFLGRGGMAAVWAAVDERLSRPVAIKTIPSLVMADRRLRRALEEEARFVLDLHHERIRAVHSIEDDPAAGSYLVMELVEGMSLDDVLAERPEGKLTPEEAAEIGRQICEGVEYAHGKGVIHRDLKPKNLFLHGVTDVEVRSPLDLKRIQVKVMDFGLGVRVRDSVVSRSGYTNTSGTLAYMSPEQLNGGKPSMSMDVYGLGATMYELLTGEAPFTGGDVAGQILRMPARRVPDSPAWLADFVAACLGKEADLRPASMAVARAILDARGPSPERLAGAQKPTPGAGRPAATPKGRAAAAVDGPPSLDQENSTPPPSPLSSREPIEVRAADEARGHVDLKGDIRLTAYEGPDSARNPTTLSNGERVAWATLLSTIAWATLLSTILYLTLYGLSKALAW